MITFQVERWNTYYPECIPLWEEHYEEIGNRRFPMGPDTHYFQFLDTSGQLVILTCRENGVMRGYFLSVVKRHTHYPALYSFEDSYFMSKGLRGKAAIKMLKENERVMRERGVKVIAVMTKMNKDVSKIWERLGYTHSYNVFDKFLEG